MNTSTNQGANMQTIEDQQKLHGLSLKAFREDQGLSLRQLARKAGVSHGSIHKWERGKVSKQHPLLLRAVSDALGISSAQLSQYLEGGEKDNEQ